MKKMNCIFCKIINGEIPSYTIYEDEMVKAFLDVNPDSNGHTLIVPKQHYQDIEDIPDDVLLHVFQVAKKIKQLLEEKLKIDGVTFVQNNGIVQEVKHFHLHIKPCYKISTLVSVEDIYKQLKESL